MDNEVKLSSENSQINVELPKYTEWWYGNTTHVSELISPKLSKKTYENPPLEKKIPKELDDKTPFVPIDPTNVEFKTFKGTEDDLPEHIDIDEKLKKQKLNIKTDIVVDLIKEAEENEKEEKGIGESTIKPVLHSMEEKKFYSNTLNKEIKFERPVPTMGECTYKQVDANVPSEVIDDDIESEVSFSYNEFVELNDKKIGEFSEREYSNGNDLLNDIDKQIQILRNRLNELNSDEYYKNSIYKAAQEKAAKKKKLKAKNLNDPLVDYPLPDFIDYINNQSIKTIDNFENFIPLVDSGEQWTIERPVGGFKYIKRTLEPPRPYGKLRLRSMPQSVIDHMQAETVIKRKLSTPKNLYCPSIVIKSDINDRGTYAERKNIDSICKKDQCHNRVRVSLVSPTDIMRQQLEERNERLAFENNNSNTKEKISRYTDISLEDPRYRKLKENSKEYIRPSALQCLRELNRTRDPNALKQLTDPKKMRELQLNKTYKIQEDNTGVLTDTGAVVGRGPDYYRFSSNPYEIHDSDDLQAMTAVISQLRSDEAHLISMMRECESERLRPPVQNWYEIKSNNFHDEAIRARVYIDGSRSADNIKANRIAIGAISSSEINSLIEDPNFDFEVESVNVNKSSSNSKKMMYIDIDNERDALNARLITENLNNNNYEIEDNKNQNRLMSSPVIKYQNNSFRSMAESYGPQDEDLLLSPLPKPEMKDVCI